MPRYGIYWDIGYGSYDADIIEADDKEAARKIAYEKWKQAAEDNADYGFKVAPVEAVRAEHDQDGTVFYHEDGLEIDDDEPED